MMSEANSLNKAYERALETLGLREEEISEHYYWFIEGGLLFRFRRRGHLEYEWALLKGEEALEISEEEANKLLSQQK